MSDQSRYGRGESRPHTARQHELEEFKAKFTRTTQHGADLLAYLERSDCGVWRCEQDRIDPRRWWLNVTLPDRVAEMFDAHLELQMVYAEYSEVEPRLLELMQQRTARNARLDHGVFLIASLDPNVNRLLRRRRGEFAAIDINLAELGTAAPDMRHKMSEALTAVDQFHITTPVRDPSGFFGRAAELQQIVAAIERGQSIGVFGLRKTGKTSLLNYVAAQRREGGRPVVWVDISGLADADDFRLRLLEKVRERVVELNPEAMVPPKIRTLDKHGNLKVSPALLRLHWLRDIETLAKHSGLRLEIFIDEVDQLYPERSHLGLAAQDLLIALTQLRGMIQSAEPHSGMVLVCAGVDPALFERPLLRSGADNLLYKLVRLMFLAPLSRDEMADMVRDLGRRMGVRVRDHQVIDFLFEEYGGHALLTRFACSISCSGRPRDAIPWHMSLKEVEQTASMTGEGSPSQQAAEILESFGEWYPDEAGLLREIWSSDAQDREIGQLIFDEDSRRLSHAAQYGLVLANSSNPRIRAVEKSVSAAKN